MAKEGNTYTGFLYAGLMIMADGTPKVIEYNCRFGDPETQPIMMRLRSDLVELCQAAMNKQLDKQHADWDPRPALGVVLASDGYPNSYEKGKIISGLKQTENSSAKVFHAGTALENEQVVTAGGRVLCATALGDSVTEAKRNAYDALSKISWDGVFFRRDIGYKAENRENKFNQDAS